MALTAGPGGSASAAASCPNFGFLDQWGSSGSGDGQFGEAYGVATDKHGYVYVTDPDLERIQKFSPSGTFITKWGSQGSGPGQFFSSLGVATDSTGNVYATDYGNNRVQKFAPSGTLLQVWGNKGTKPGQFVLPRAIATGPDDRVYVSDQSRIQVFSPTGAHLATWPLGNVSGLAVDSSGSVYLAQGYGAGNRIRKVSSTGSHVLMFGSTGTGNGQFMNVKGLAVTSAGHLFAVDEDNKRVQRFTLDGTFLSSFGTHGSENGQFGEPYNVAVSGPHVYVTDSVRGVQKFGPRPCQRPIPSPTPNPPIPKPPVNPPSFSNVLVACPDDSTEGDDLDMGGVITPPGAGRSIAIDFISPAGAVNTVLVQTDAAGNFFASHDAYDDGDWQIRIRPGGGQHVATSCHTEANADADGDNDRRRPNNRRDREEPREEPCPPGTIRIGDACVTLPEGFVRSKRD